MAREGSKDTAPLISVVAPCYNGARTIGLTLESVARQTYPNIEIIVVYDGSVDESAQTVMRFAEQDSRVRLLRQANAGVAAARNAGISAAQGVFVAPIDADDLWRHDKLERQYQALADGRAGLAYCWFDHINEDDGVFPGGFRYTYEGQVFERLCDVDFLGNGSVALIRTDLLRQVGGYDPSLRARGGEGCEDWKLSLELARTTAFAVVPEVLVGYRISRGNMSGKVPNMIRSAALVIDDIAARHPDLAPRLARHLMNREAGGLVRTVKQGDWADAAWLAERLLKTDPVRAVTLVSNIVGATVAGMLTRAVARMASRQSRPTFHDDKFAESESERREPRPAPH